MNRKLLLFILILLIFSPFTAPAQKTLSTLDQSLRYSLYSRLGLKVIPLQVNDSTFKVQFVIEKIEENPDFNTFSFSYSILNSYDEEITPEKVNLLTPEDLLTDTDRHWFFEKTLSLKPSTQVAVVLLTVLDTRQGDEYVYHTDLKSPFVSEIPDFGIYFSNGVPFDQNYINVKESLLFKTIRRPNIHSFYYPIKFEVPFPPMETRPAEVPRELEVINQRNRGGRLLFLPNRHTCPRRNYFEIDS